MAIEVLSVNRIGQITGTTGPNRPLLVDPVGNPLLTDTGRRNVIGVDEGATAEHSDNGPYFFFGDVATNLSGKPRRTPLTLAAQEKKIARGALPSAVQKVVQEQSQGATIKGYSTEVEHGRRVYEVEMIVNGHTRDIQIATDGTLNEIEEEVALYSLPNAVQVALSKRLRERRSPRLNL